MQNKRTDQGILMVRVLSVTRFLVAINSILGQLGDGVDGSIFADDLAIYITIRNQKVAAKALKRLTVRCMSNRERINFFTSKTINKFI